MKTKNARSFSSLQPASQRLSVRESLTTIKADVSSVTDQLIFWTTLPLRLLFPPLSPNSSSKISEQNIRVAVEDIRLLIRTAENAGVDHGIFSILNTLVVNRGQIERTIVLWVDLIEVLVQEQEQIYGPRAGLGQIKAAELRRILKYLLRGNKLSLPNIPPVLQPLVLDYVIGWIVDLVVRACNNNGLWEPVQPNARYFFRLYWVKFKQLLGKIFNPVVKIIVQIILWYREIAAESGILLSPRVRGAIDAVRENGTIVNETDVVRQVIGLISWIGEHRDQVIAAFDLVLTTIQEVENYTSMSGPEKKEYAINLILIVLDELGFNQWGGLMGEFIKAIVSSAIEVGVHLFNKRGIFEK